jgi:hypothetical protein
MSFCFHFRDERRGPTELGLGGELIVRHLKNKISRPELMSSPTEERAFK